jgi:hypothetical protein
MAMLTVMTEFSALVLTLIILVPVRSSQENAISMPNVRRNVCARRSRPASARGFFTHAVALEMSARACARDGQAINIGADDAGSADANFRPVSVRVNGNMHMQ